MPLLIRTSFVRALGLFVLLVAHLAIITHFYPVFAEQKGPLLKLAENLGEILSRDSKLAAMSEWGYISSQQFFKFSNTLGTGAAILFAAGAIAGETQRGTLEIWLARPVSRARLFTERWIAGALALVIPLLLSSALLQPIAELNGVDLRIPTARMLRAGLYESVFLLVFYSISFAWSVFAPRVITIVLGMIFSTGAMFALYLVPEANEWSIYQWTDVETFVRIEERGLSALHWMRPISVCVAATVVAWFGFRRRLPY